jgi:hypothetical protein
MPENAENPVLQVYSEQALAQLKDAMAGLAKAVAAYYRELRTAGFSKPEAIMLASELQGFLLDGANKFARGK